MTYIKWIYL